MKVIVARILIVSSLAAILLLAELAAAHAETSGDNPDAVKRLLAEGANPNVPDLRGRTAVHQVAENAVALVLGALLEAGATPTSGTGTAAARFTWPRRILTGTMPTPAARRRCTWLSATQAPLKNPRSWTHYSVQAQTPASRLRRGTSPTMSRAMAGGFM